MIVLPCFLPGQVGYNHPELDWKTFETDHFRIHFTPETEHSAREGAFVAETIYAPVTLLYNYEPPDKTHIIFLDTDDYSNGIAYFYENKIEIWVSPLDLELRGSHRWLQNVITHEFVHIVSIQKAMKFPIRVPAGYVQWIGYEEEKREDVLYGYPNTLVSYPLPGTVVPPWLAEGTAQYMFGDASYDFWDTHRDMILRDQVIHEDLRTLNEMSVFGKSGVGNESIYNTGFALVRFIAFKYGEEALTEIVKRFSRPFTMSVNAAIQSVLGVSSGELYADFKATLDERYRVLTERVKAHETKGMVIIDKGTANLYPAWAPDEKRFAYLSNSGNDFFSQTDLYVYSFETGESERITRGAVSKPAWDSKGEFLYYARRSEHDHRGSRWYDLYRYSFEDEKEHRLTEGARAFSPLLLPGDSTLAYVASSGGTQNIFFVNLNSSDSDQLTDFEPGTQLFSLAYDSTQNWIMFDYLKNHFRSTGVLKPGDSTFTPLIATEEWDERDVSPGPEGGIVYANDKNGIFNLYTLNPSTGEQGFISNVLGGAFMPDVSRTGKILFSAYEQGGYAIALLDTLSILDAQMVGYGPNYFLKFQNLPGPLVSLDSSSASNHDDSFSRMFIFPKVMIDYGTIKPGLYFNANEVLGKLSLFGGASVNLQGDLDLFLLYEFRKLYPTLFVDVYYLTRHISEQSRLWDVYDFDVDVSYRLFQMDAGVRIPIRGIHELTPFVSYQNFRSSSIWWVGREDLFGKSAIDYYTGRHTGIKWTSAFHRPTVDYAINPGNGFRVDLDIRNETDRFFNAEESVFEAVFDNYRFFRVFGKAVSHLSLPATNRWTVTGEIQAGWMSDTEVDSFFNFFSGGLSGLKGYAFYDVEGNRTALVSITLRIPVLREYHIPVGPFMLQNLVTGFVAQAGDAWNGGSGSFRPKRSLGFQVRLGGYSFYNYPTGIGVEFHRGLDKFPPMGERDGPGLRTYFTLLLGF